MNVDFCERAQVYGIKACPHVCNANLEVGLVCSVVHLACCVRLSDLFVRSQFQVPVENVRPPPILAQPGMAGSKYGGPTPFGHGPAKIGCPISFGHGLKKIRCPISCGHGLEKLRCPISSAPDVPPPPLLEWQTRKWMDSVMHFDGFRQMSITAGTKGSGRLVFDSSGTKGSCRLIFHSYSRGRSKILIFYSK